MCLQMQNLSNPTKDDHPYDFSPLPLNTSKGPLQVNSSTSEDNMSRSEVCIPMSMLILVPFFIMLPAFINIGSSGCLLPELEINSFSISNLNISASKMMAVWDTNIRFQHFKRNSASTEVMHFDQVEGYIFYKNMDNKLAAAKRKGFSLRPDENKTVQMKFVKTGLEVDQSGVEDEDVIKEISRELENGVMHFNLRIDLEISSARLGIGFDFSFLAIHSYCWDLMAGVDLSIGKGKLISAQCVKCNIK